MGEYFWARPSVSWGPSRIDFSFWCKISRVEKWNKNMEKNVNKVQVFSFFPCGSVLLLFVDSKLWCGFLLSSLWHFLCEQRTVDISTLLIFSRRLQWMIFVFYSWVGSLVLNLSTRTHQGQEHDTVLCVCEVASSFWLETCVYLHVVWGEKNRLVLKLCDEIATRQRGGSMRVRETLEKKWRTTGPSFGVRKRCIWVCLV